MPVIVVTLKDRELQRVVITATTTTIGRDHRCDVAIDNPALSRHHATIQCHRGMFGLRDEGSANGIFVNGARVQGARLNDGDVISLGKFRLQFLMAGGPDVTELLDVGEALSLDEGHNPEMTMAISLADIEKMAVKSGELPGSGAGPRANAAPVGRSAAPVKVPLASARRQGSGDEKTGLNPLLVVAVVGLLGIVAVLSAALVWVVFLR